MVKKELRRNNKYVVTDILLKISNLKKLSLNEFLVLMYLDNNYSDSFELELMSECLGIDNNSCLEAFNSLVMKSLVTIESKKTDTGKYKEIVSIDNIYNIVELEDNNVVVNDNTDIFNTFEKELGRTLSSYELEMINGWLLSGSSEELIIGALREAIFNGTTGFRYIDRILYEWEKNGFKTMEDVNNHMKNKREERIKGNEELIKKEQDLLDYDWLND